MSYEIHRIYLKNETDMKTMYEKFLSDSPKSFWLDTETNGLDISVGGSVAFLITFGWKVKNDIFIYAVWEIPTFGKYLGKMLLKTQRNWAFNAKFDLNILRNTYNFGTKDLLVHSKWYDIISLWRLTHNVDDPTKSVALKSLAKTELRHDASDKKDEIASILTKLNSKRKIELKKFIKEKTNLILTSDKLDLIINDRNIFVDNIYYDLYNQFCLTNPVPTYQTVFGLVPDLVIEYGMDDIEFSILLTIKYWSELNKRQQLEIFEKEQKIVLPIANQERNGIEIDPNYLEESIGKVREYCGYIDNCLDKLINDIYNTRLLDENDVNVRYRAINIYAYKTRKQKGKTVSIGSQNAEKKLLKFLEVWKPNPKINLNSTEHINFFLLFSFGLKSDKWDKNALENILDKVKKLNNKTLIELNLIKFIEYLFIYRRIRKWANTYVGRFAKLLSESRTNRIHPSFNAYKVVTGRFSSPFHQQPKDEILDVRNNELLFNPRKIVKVPKDSIGIVCLDLSQIEIRVNAHFTHMIGHPDKVLDDVLLNGKDMHSITAAQAFHPVEFAQDPDKACLLVSKENRNAAKNLNFALQYGGGVNSIRNHPKLMHLSVELQDKLLNAYDKTRTGTRAYQKWAIECMQTQTIEIDGKTLHYVENLYKRRYYATPDWAFREAYKAINYLIQGTCADALKDSLYKVDKFLNDNNCKSKLILNVHDEIQVELYENEEWIIPYLKSFMEDMSWSVYIPIICDIELFKTSWNEKYEVVYENSMLIPKE